MKGGRISVSPWGMPNKVGFWTRVGKHINVFLPQQVVETDPISGYNCTT